MGNLMMMMKPSQPVAAKTTNNSGKSKKPLTIVHPRQRKNKIQEMMIPKKPTTLLDTLRLAGGGNRMEGKEEAGGTDPWGTLLL